VCKDFKFAWMQGSFPARGEGQQRRCAP
jgi:hypothetical protein